MRLLTHVMDKLGFIRMRLQEKLYVMLIDPWDKPTYREK